MNSASKLDELIEKYEENPILRGLVQLIPFGIGSSAEAALLTYVQNIRIDRLRTFFDELADGKIELSSELLESEDFLHAYFSTLKAVSSTRRREKITLLGKYFKNSFKLDKMDIIDDFEELLSILDELSYREILVLSKLYKFEIEYRDSVSKSGGERAKLYWDSFVLEIVTELNIKMDEVISYLQRIQRTGCYEVYDAFWGNDKHLGHLTPTFYRLVELLEIDK